MNELAYFTYEGSEKSNSSDRDVVVIDGQAYYKSSGISSGLPGTYAPFFMAIGTKIGKSPKLPSHDVFEHEVLLSTIYNYYYPRYLIKVEPGYLKNADLNDLQVLQIHPSLVGRFGRKQDIINSIRLGGGIWASNEIKNNAFDILKLTDEEKKIANQPFTIARNCERKSKDPDELNNWLLKKNTSFVEKIFEINSIIKHKQTKLSPENLDREKEKLKNELTDYIKSRRAEEVRDKSKFRTFFGWLSGMSSDLKIGAAEKMVKALKNPNESITFSGDEVVALKNGNLGKIIKYYNSTIIVMYYLDNIMNPLLKIIII